MEDPGAGAGGREDRRIAVLEPSGDGGAAVAATPVPGGCLMVARAAVIGPMRKEAGCEEVCGASEARLFTSEVEDKGGDFAVRLVDPVEIVSASLKGRMCEVKGSSPEERPMGMEVVEDGHLPFTPQVSTEPGSSWTCHAANGGLSDMALHFPSGEAGCSKDVGFAYGTLDKATGASLSEWEDMAGNSGGDWGGTAEVNTCMKDLQIASKEANHCNVGSLDSMKPSSEQWPLGVHGLGAIADANNEPQHNHLVPNVQGEICRPLHADSVPSVSGIVGVSLDGKPVQFRQISGHTVTSHMADGGLQNNSVLCEPAGCMYDTVDMVTKGNPCEQNSFSGEGVLCGGVNVKTSLEDLEMFRKEPQDDNKGLSDRIGQLPYGTAFSSLKESANPDLEKYDLFLKVTAEASLTMHDPVPSVAGSATAVSLNGKTGHIAKLSEHRARMENIAFSSQGGGAFPLESAFHKEPPLDESCCSKRVVHTSKEELGTGWMEGAHDAGELSDLVEHHTEELPFGADGLTLITGANHVPVGSCPVVEASVPSFYGTSIDDCSDGKGVMMDISERSSNVEKLACNSQGGDMLFCESVLQESSMEASSKLNLSACKSIMEELKPHGPCTMKGAQQISQKYGISDLPSGRVSSSHMQCDDEPCCSGREPSVLCPGHQDSGVGRSGSLDHSEKGLNTFNSADDKAGSVDFVSNGNDTESKSQQLSTVLVFRRRNPKRAASSRILHSEKPDQTNKASSGSRRPKKVGIGNLVHQSTTSMLANKVTRGRSGFIRPHKSSTWGSLEKLMDGFSQSYGPLDSNSHPTCLENKRSNKRSDQKNLPNIRKCRSSRSSKSRSSTLPDIVHLTDASLEGYKGVIPRLTSHVSEFRDGTSTQQLKSDLVSSTQEISAAYIHGECAKLSTSVPLKSDNGTVVLPVGFSPDSVLEVASVTCESNASASHDVILHENSPDAGALNGDGHNSIVLPTSCLGRDQAPPLMHLEQQAETAPSQAIIDNDVDKGKEQTVQKSKTARKNSDVRKLGSKKKDGTTGKNSIEASKPRAFSNDAILPDPSELLVHSEYPEHDSCFELQTSSTEDLGTHGHSNMQSRSITDNGAFHTTKSSKHKRKDANARKKDKLQDQHTKGKGKKKHGADVTSLDCGLSGLHFDALATSHTNEQSNHGPTAELASMNSGTISTDLPKNVVCKMEDSSVPAAVPPRAAWVCCDDCQKWRCIPAELADVIGETNCRWTCKDNGDKAFADCSIPQEKTNAEINAELELSDVSADEADGDGSNSKACRAPSWTHVRLNLFLHRNRRTQSIDESMVCNCKPPQDGRMGCGDGCLNRMLNIECVKRTCPCGEQCSNQQFQRRNYAKLRWFHSGKKGYGLQLQEDVSEGRFLIEYVGEVLDIASYESRQQYYASKGQKHFYFMALNGGEVIDACTKGNLGRFINHSCSPNCRTEKWMVNGEVCIGIFAMRNIKKGEELTFDYNYVRVSGAAPQKCFCRTAKCRGYIGGDISIVDAINQDDAEAVHFEHIVHKDSEGSMGANRSGSDGSHPDITEPEFSIYREDWHDCPAAKAENEPLKQPEGTLSDTSEPENSLETWSPQEDEDVIRTPVHVSRTVESSLQHFPVHSTQSSDCLRKTPYTTEIVRPPNVVNGSAPSSDSGGNLVPGFNANKRNNIKHNRNAKPSSRVDNEHILGVERGLNNLLDRDGGISKRKDATNGYLKLLFLTAAEGDSFGGTSKSVRDLSLILDALLKTKSRTVLLDIINKNGLQMLHNILKHNRSNFHRIPILRKLLKVLEFLALKEILTSEHINEGPRFAGFESFRDSMLSLTRHNDIQVHQIARNFRDRWIPRNIARSEPTQYPRTCTPAQDSRGNNMAWNFTRRKRKSRWDYQPDEHYKMVGLKFQKAYCEHGTFDVTGLMRYKMEGHPGANRYRNDVPGIVNSTESADDEVPPGFESQRERPPVQVGCEVAPGLCMGRYQPSLTISYGIPIALVQHIGTPEAEGQCHKKWKVAPGVPFNPFPPLPPYPRGSPCPTTSSQISQHEGTTSVKHNSSEHYGRTTDRDGRVHRNWRNGPRARWPFNNNHGRRFPGNHHRFERFQPSRPQ